MPKAKRMRRCKLVGCPNYIHKDRRGQQFCCDNHRDLSIKISMDKYREKVGKKYISKYKFQDYDESESIGVIKALLKKSFREKTIWRYRCRTCGIRITNESEMIRDVTEWGKMVYYCDHHCNRIKLTDEIMKRKPNHAGGSPFKTNRAATSHEHTGYKLNSIFK